VKLKRPSFALMSLLAVLLGLAISSSSSSGGAREAGASAPVIDDWTHHRVAFSNPGTLAEALRSGQLDRWLKIAHDPRYMLQQRKRQAAANQGFQNGALPSGFQLQEQTGEPAAAAEIDAAPFADRFAGVPSSQLPRGLIRVPRDVAAAARRDLHETRPKRIRVARTLHTDWSEDMGSGATVGLGQYPAKFSFSTSSANCDSTAPPDYVVFNTGLAGSSMPAQATIVAYDNLYSGCSSPPNVPNIYWQYNTAYAQGSMSGDGSTITTSVALSLDGTQVAFVQSASGVASLVLLKWAENSSLVQMDTSGNNVAAANYRSCTAPCMTRITFTNSANDTNSSPFPDYANDVIYVGDDSGTLHKFTGVFVGTPGEVSGGGWPVSVSTQPLGGPVYDSVSENIFVGDYLPLGEYPSTTCEMAGCGFLYSVTASSGAVAAQSHELDYELGVFDSPLVDSSAQTVYAFVGADGSHACSLDQQCAGVFQFPTSFANDSSGTEATVGAGFDWLMSGAFDNEYLTSGNASSPTGNLYVVGNTGLADNTLYQIFINSNVMKTITSGPEIANNFDNDYYGPGLPITEIANGAHDYLFVSVLAFGVPTDCDDDQGNGCVLIYDVSSGSISSGTTPLFAAAEAGGTSGIIVDNTSSFGGASNIYFTPLLNQSCPTSGGTGGCAIQTSQ
jgi:hypothetical protein